MFYILISRCLSVLTDIYSIYEGGNNQNLNSGSLLHLQVLSTWIVQCLPCLCNLITNFNARALLTNLDILTSHVTWLAHWNWVPKECSMPEMWIQFGYFLITPLIILCYSFKVSYAKQMWNLHNLTTCWA